MTTTVRPGQRLYARSAAAADRGSWSFERDVAWRNIDRARAYARPEILAALRDAALIEAYHPVNLSRLLKVMWDDVGILRDAPSLARGHERLLELRDSLEKCGVSGGDLRYNLTWHDWLNMESLISVSLAICRAAQARTDSRGAHFREDFPETGDLAASAFSCVTQPSCAYLPGASDGAAGTSGFTCVVDDGQPASATIERNGRSASRDERIMARTLTWRRRACVVLGRPGRRRVSPPHPF
jgi:hypothetical protein